MRIRFFNISLILWSVLSLCIYVSICFGEQTSNTDIDNAIKMYENGDYDTADKLIVSALKKDKRDVAALTWYAIIKIEMAKNKCELNMDACKLIVNKQIDYLNSYYGMEVLFLDEDILYSYYHAAYAKAYLLTGRSLTAESFADKSLSLYPKNYEALHAKGQFALYMEEESKTNIPVITISDHNYLEIAYKSFLTELAETGNHAPEIKSRAAYWAASTLYKIKGEATNKMRELLETSIKCNPNGKYGVLSKNMMEKKFNVK